MNQENLNDALTEFAERLDDVIFHGQNSSRPTGNEGFVISINAPWGAGKTFFIDFYNDRLKNKNKISSEDNPKSDVLPIVFNAWENDFFDPLSGLIGYIHEEYDKKLNTKDFKRYGIALLKSLPNAITNSHPFVNALLNGVEKNNKTEDSQNIEDYKTKKSLISEFKESLSNLKPEESKKEEPPVKLIFIDELDRCRPDYALSLLEICKHFFNTENVFFILTIDRKNFCAIIKKVYGNEFDANHYLSRFFDLELDLPISDDFHAKLIENALQYNEIKSDQHEINYACDILTILTKHMGVSARETLKNCLNVFQIFGKQLDYKWFYLTIPLLVIKQKQGVINIDNVEKFEDCLNLTKKWLSKINPHKTESTKDKKIMTDVLIYFTVFLAKVRDIEIDKTILIDMMNKENFNHYCIPNSVANEIISNLNPMHSTYAKSIWGLINNLYMAQT